jgi:hypothetical protein
VDRPPPLLVSALVSIQIPPNPLDIRGVLESSENHVATSAQNTPYYQGIVAVIDGRVAFISERHQTQSAAIALLFHHPIEHGLG